MALSSFWLFLAFALAAKATDIDTGDLAGLAKDHEHSSISAAARNLLQFDDSDDYKNEAPEEDEDSKIVEKIENIESKPKKTTLVTPGQERMGPNLFYDGQRFLMRLGKPIKVSVFRKPEIGGDKKAKLGKPVDVISLDAPAISVKGSLVNADGNELQVNLDWKEQDFGSGSMKISRIMITMKFVREKKEYSLTSLRIPQLDLGGRKVTTNPLRVRTSYGYKVTAPVGLSFCCYDPGMFLPTSPEESDDYLVGLTFPDMQLQAFELKNKGSFGPEWSCGELMSLGLWIGLIVTFFFALICYYGFSMLANVQTMDRFDDPKGKTIYVPQTD